MTSKSSCRFSKVYPLQLFEGSPEWTPKSDVKLPERDLPSGQVYLFLHDNYVVTCGAHADRAIVFDAVTPTWMTYCREALAFDVPAPIRDGSAD